MVIIGHGKATMPHIIDGQLYFRFGDTVLRVNMDGRSYSIPSNRVEVKYCKEAQIETEFFDIHQHFFDSDPLILDDVELKMRGGKFPLKDELPKFFPKGTLEFRAGEHVGAIEVPEDDLITTISRTSGNLYVACDNRVYNFRFPLER